MQIYAPSEISHVLDGSGINAPVSMCLKKHPADSMINGEAAESHTGLSAFSTIYEKQMSQNHAGSCPGLCTDTLVSC